MAGLNHRERFRISVYLHGSQFFPNLQMTVVEAYVGGKKVDPPDDKSLLPPKLTSLLIEGIAQNSTGSVFLPEVGQ